VLSAGQRREREGGRGRERERGRLKAIILVPPTIQE